MKPWQMTRDEYLRHSYMLSHRLAHMGCVPATLGAGYTLPLPFKVMRAESIEREQQRIECFLQYRAEYWEKRVWDKPRTDTSVDRAPASSVSRDIVYACNRSGCYESTIESIYRAHAHHCAEAVKRGYTLPEAVLNEYPGLRNWKPARLYMQLVVVENALERPFFMGLQGGVA